MVDRAFAKQRHGPDAAAFFATEAAGLSWLAVPGGPPVPRVFSVTSTSITLERIATGSATPDAAERLGHQLATLHATGAPSFGASPPDAPRKHGWIGDLPMTYAGHESFASFWAEERIRDAARAAAGRGGLSEAELARVERFADDVQEGRVDVGPPEAPSRLHGDLWSGNVLWGADGRAWVIDPAAHGGHRESDLAMLALFGAPHLDRITAAYDEAAPLADGWRSRVPLHQVWPLLVHAALFGGGYGRQALAAIKLAPRT
jgi:fructosamine-3-kinase